MKRLLAVAVALLLIIGALLFRSSRNDSDDVTTKGPKGDGGALTLGCVSELIEVCESLEGVTVVEVNPGDVADQARKIDAWVTFDPWPEAVAFENEGLFNGKPLPLAQDRLGLVLSEPYQSELGTSCQESITLCAAQRIDDGGDLLVGDLETASGGVLMAAAGTELVGSADYGVDEIADQQSLFADVEQSTSSERGSSASQLQSRLRLGDGAPTAVLCRQHDARVVNSPQGKDKQLVFLPLEPALLMRVVVAPIADDRRDDLEDLAGDEATAEAFEKAGWRPPSKGKTGLPPGDVLLLLGP